MVKNIQKKNIFEHFMINKIYFSADLHFAHSNIIKYCNRPFQSVYEMDQILYNNWCSIVQPEDIVVVIGDLSIVRRPNQLSGTQRKYIQTLPGRKLLITGNHDKLQMQEFLKELDWVILNEIVGEDFRIIHNPYLDKNEYKFYEDKKFLLHGHCHGHHPNTPTRIDVGVDVFGMKPIELKTVAPNELQQSIQAAILDAYVAQKGCLGIIFGTFIVCGEEGNYCSESCLRNAKA
jgi:calcineurin-like phosphoesterase family protein